jgi:hypothetical protein
MCGWQLSRWRISFKKVKDCYRIEGQGDDQRYNRCAEIARTIMDENQSGVKTIRTKLGGIASFSQITTALLLREFEKLAPDDADFLVARFHG